TVNGSPIGPIAVVLRAMGETPPTAPNPKASGLEAMRAFWQAAGLEGVETTVIRIPITFAGFDDLWSSVDVPVGPLGNFISKMTADAKAQFRARLREQLPAAADGRIVYEATANGVRGRVPG